ncbi:MAG: ADP-forming succinate--CoA ligase subunit beta [Desulfobacterales bacterium]|nr:ADP-forming succinate--CoA ligase subunit beta [Desulfobacterales bacterium]
MKIHEYQAKELFRLYQIPVPNGNVASTVQEAMDAAKTMENNFPMVVKAQIHAGGRGKGGGVKLAKSLEELQTFSETILGMQLVTHQTGKEGKLVRKVLIEQGLTIQKEFYLGIIIDREKASIVIMASTAGGMDIEKVAEEHPEQIIKVCIDPLMGIQPCHARQLAYSLDIPASAMKSFTKLVFSSYLLFLEKDCSLLEINPLVYTAAGEWIALDAKVTIDDNSLFRHPEFKEYRDIYEEDPLEVEASTYKLNYINMDGNLGNIVNGAGLAMATMDMIKQAGAEPANFLDVGGGATQEMVEQAFKIILKDTKVKGILINIFGGILRCDVFAQGVVKAAQKTSINVPVIVRMEGTNVTEGRRILNESGLSLITAIDIKDASQKVAQLMI